MLVSASVNAAEVAVLTLAQICGPDYPTAKALLQEAARYYRVPVASEDVDALKTILARGVRGDWADHIASVAATAKICEEWLESGVKDFVRLSINEARSTP